MLLASLLHWGPVPAATIHPAYLATWYPQDIVTWLIGGSGALGDLVI